MRKMKGAPSPVLYSRAGFVCVDEASEEAAQKIRLLDVFVIGPLMVYAAGSLRSPLAALILGASGLLTILYNGRNFHLVKQAQKTENRPRVY